MSTITRLSAQKKDRSRVNIEVDGEFVTGLPLEEVVKQRLKVGQEVESSVLSSWKELDDKGKILGKVINFLSYRPRTTKEVTIRLNTYTEDVGIKEYVMQYLGTHNLLDDLAFADWWVKSRQDTRSSRVLQQELRLKGIDNTIIHQVLSPVSDRDALLTILNKKGLNLDRAKLYRYCLGKGFSYDLVSQVFAELGIGAHLV